MNAEFRAIVSGRVQFVMYRDFAGRKARALGVSGTVRNLSDGTVEIIAQGDRAVLLSFIKKLNKGPVLAKVEQIKIEWREPKETIGGFNILY